VQESFIALTEGMTILGNRRRRDGRITEPGMVLKIRWMPIGNITPGSLEAIVEALLVDRTRCRGRRRWRIVSRLWVRAASEHQYSRDQGYRDNFHPGLRLKVRPSVAEGLYPKTSDHEKSCRGNLQTPTKPEAAYPG